MGTRFKIDLNEYRSEYFPFALFRWRKREGLFDRSRWEQLQSFKTQAEARAFYETIKDLPEYLA